MHYMCGTSQVGRTQSGVEGCESGFRKIYLHVTAVCANCKGGHQATSGKCPAKQRAKKEAKKKKRDKNKGKLNDIPKLQLEIGGNPGLRLEIAEQNASSEEMRIKNVEF